MKNIQTVIDKAAVAISMLCVAHCLVLPVALTLLPVLAATPLENEVFHQILVIAVLPTSLFALTMGCRQHKSWMVFVWGCMGLLLLVVAAVLGHAVLGEFGEKGLTVLGSVLIAMGHIRNFRLCKTAPCPC